MKIRATDTNGDWTFGKGKSNYRTELEAVAGNIKSRLLSWRGDCFFAPAEGVDYNNFMDKGTKDLLDSDIKRVILQSEGVLRINTYDSRLDNSIRGFTAEANILTIYGDFLLEV